MKAITFFLLTLIVAISLSACKVETINGTKSETVKTVNTAAKDFNSITISYPAEVIYTPSDTFSVAVKAPEDQIDNVKVYTKGSQLIIEESKEIDKKYLFRGHHDNDITVIVKTPYLQRVSIAGSGSFRCDSTMTSKSLDLAIAGSGEIDIKDIRAVETALSIAGSGEIDAGLTNVGNTSVEIAGSGDVSLDLHKCKSVYTSIAGSGDIELSGDVETLKQRIAGSGSINTDKLKVLNK